MASVENGCSNETDREVDQVPEIYFFPGGEATCPIGDFSRGRYKIIEESSSGFVVNVLIDGKDGQLFTDHVSQHTIDTVKLSVVSRPDSPIATSIRNIS